VTLLRLSVIGTPTKENEHRLPLHPEHLAGLDPDLRERVTHGYGYGARFGHSDADPDELVAGFASREEILADSDVVVLPKPQQARWPRSAPARSSGDGPTASGPLCSPSWR